MQDKDNLFLFRVQVNEYHHKKSFEVYRPASLDAPADHAVMFLMLKMQHKLDVFFSIHQCLIFWPDVLPIPPEIEARHAVIPVKEPRLEYCRFFKKHGIRNLPSKEDYTLVNGGYICSGAVVPESSMIMPGAYIGGEVTIGENCYIGAGAKLVGKIQIGSNVIIRENTVIGADGLSTDRDLDGTGITMPQFGGVCIHDDVEIGANVVIARGAIDDTVIERGCKIDNSSFISHNVTIGHDTFIVGETILFGSSKIGARAFISGNATVRNQVIVGNDAQIGMGSVVTKNVGPGQTVMGVPAKER